MLRHSDADAMMLDTIGKPNVNVIHYKSHKVCNLRIEVNYFKNSPGVSCRAVDI